MTARITLALSLLLVTVIAFTDGGASESSRAAFLAGCLIVLALSMLCPGPVVPEGRPARLALGGLAGLTIVSLLSGLWTTSPGGWTAASELAIAYLALTFATVRALSAEPRLATSAAPALLASAILVVGYGLCGRAMPELLSAETSVVAGGRLFAPVGYWNAMGLIAALGLVYCAGVQLRTPRALGPAAAALAASPLLGAGVALSYSRTAIAAAAAGLLLTVLLDRRAEAARAAGLVAGAALLGAASTAPFAAVRHGDVAGNAGAGWLLLLAAVCAVAGAISHRLPHYEAPAVLTSGARRATALLLVAVCLVPFVAALTTREDAGSKSFGATAGRLTETASNRAQYWGVAVDAWISKPATGHGAGSFEGLWLKDRTIDEKVHNAHSLWLETAAELGLAGLLMLGLLVTGAATAIRRGDPATAALSGAVVAWTLAASVDWQWQVPAVTGSAMLALGAVLSAARTDPAPTTAD